MSRRYRKLPSLGTTTVSSERRYKATEHQRERHHVRLRLRASRDDTDRRLNIGEMRGNGAGILAAAGDLHHHFGRAPHGPSDLFDLRRAEAPRLRWSRATKTGHLEKWELASRQAKRSSTHTGSPSSEVPPAPDRLCAALQPQRRSGSVCVPGPGAARAVESLPGCHSGRSGRGPALPLQAR